MVFGPKAWLDVAYFDEHFREENLSPNSQQLSSLHAMQYGYVGHIFDAAAHTGHH